MKEINIAKGFAMLGVLYIHLISVVGQSSGGFNFKYQSFNISSLGGFVLPMFFVIAGFTYTKTKKTIKVELKQKVLEVLKYFTKYFLIIGALYSAIVLILKKLTFTECLRAMLCEYLTRATCNFIGENFYYRTVFHDIFVATWYVWVYMLSMALFILIIKIPTKTIKGEIVVLAITGLVSATVYCVSPELPFEVNIVPSMVFIMYASQLVKKYKLYQKLIGINNTAKRIFINLILFLFSMYCLSFCSVAYLSHGTFSNPFNSQGMEQLPTVGIWIFSILGIMLGSFEFINICRLVSRIPVVGDYISYMGVNSLDTMLIHTFFALTICDVFGLKCGRLLSANDTITSMVKLQCWFVFAVTLVLCYIWPKFKMKVIKIKNK